MKKGAFFKVFFIVLLIFINMQVFAYASEDTKKTVEFNITDESSSQLLEKKFEITNDLQELTAIINSKNSYEECSEEEKLKICNFYNFSSEQMDMLGKQGCSLVKSIQIAFMQKESGFSIQEVETLISLYDDYNEALIQVAQYSKFDKKYKYEKGKEFFLKGFTVKEIESALKVSKAIGCDLEQIIIKEKVSLEYNNKLDNDEIEALKYIEENYKVDINKVLDLSEDNNKSLKELKDKIVDSEVNSNESLADSMELTSSPTFNGLEDERTNYNKYFNAPFTINQVGNENISPANGSLNYNINVLNLPGKNGMNLSIYAQYNSDNAQVFKAGAWLEDIDSGEYIINFTNYTFAINNEGVIIPIRTVIEYYGRTSSLAYINSLVEQHEKVVYKGKTAEGYNYYTSTTVDYFQDSKRICHNTTDKYTFEELNSNLGTGWHFAFPSIEFINSTKLLHLPNGSVYEFKITSNDDTDSNLVKYELKDIRLENDTGNFNVDSSYSSYVLIHKNGNREYFGSDGRYLGICDRYGNCIKFRHTMINNYPVITKITDTMGREINIIYNDTTSGREVRISLAGQADRVFCLEGISSLQDEFIMTQYIDEGKRETKFSYSIQEASFNYANKTLPGMTNYYASINSITYPSKAVSKFAYDKKVGNFSSSGAYEYWKIISREDIDNEVVYNKFDYSYEGDFSGYPLENNPSELSNTYTYSTTISNDKQSTTYYFNNKHLLTKQEIKDKANTLKIINYEYYLNRIPIKTQVTSFSGQGSQCTKETSAIYNELGDIISSTNELGGITYFEYEPNYHIVKKSYTMENTVATNVVNYTVDDKGNITQIVKLHNEKDINNSPIDKSITTTCTYDVSGNIINQKITQAGSEKLEIIYEYSDIYGGAYLTKKTTITTDPVTNKVYKSIEIFEYNFNTGLKTSYRCVDESNINDTKKNIFEYDLLGRLTKEINLNGTSKSVSYDDAKNITTLENENGYKVSQYYDGLGKLVKIQEYDGTKWITIGENSYNAYGEIEWTKDALGKITRFEYDSLGRVIKTIFPDDTEQLDDNEFVHTEYIDGQNKKIEYNEEEHPHYYIYDNQGNLVEEGQNKTDEGGQTSNVGKKYIYDSYGKLRQVTDINNEEIKTTYSYDDISRMTSVENALGEITNYEYDYSNNIITQHTAGGSITRRNYDGLGRLCQEKDPTGKTESYVYDARGNVISKTDKSGTLFTYTYTDTNLLKTVSSTRGDANTEYFYDLAGQVTSVIKNGLNTQYEYYYNGLLKKETSPDTKSISYTYNLDGTKASMTDQFGKITNYEHDARGRLKKVIVDSQDTVYDYYSDGSRKSIVYSNGVKTEYSYNECNKLTNLVNKKIVDLNNEIIIDDFKYTYDYCGNQTSKKENNITTNFTYDNLNRVIDVVKSDGSKVIYSYDNNGNIKNETSVNLGGQSTIINRIFEYDEANFKLKKEIKNTIDLSTGSISASSTSVNADEVITFNLFGSINTDDQALNQLLNETTWSTSSTKLVLNSFKGKTITGSIPKIYWDQMLSNETITIKASLYNKVYQININKKPIPQLSSLTITPTGAYLLGDESKVFTISGKMTDGTIAPTSILINAIWVASSTKINLSGTTGKSITVVIPKANWDLMLTTQVITLKASIGTIKAEAKIYKKGAYVTLKSLSITPSSATFSKGQTKSFTVSGIMSDGTAAPDSLLSTAEWNTTSSSFSLSKTTGKSIYVSFGAAMYISKESETSSISSNSVDKNALVVFPTTKNLFATIGSISVGVTLKISELPSPFQSSMDVENDDVITNKPLIALDTKNVGLLSPLLTSGLGNAAYTEIFFEYDNDNNLITVREGSSTGPIRENYEYNELNQLVKLTDGNGLTSYTYNTSGLRNSKTQGTNKTSYYYDGDNVIIETINNNFSARNIMGINPIARETKTSKLYYLYNGHADVVAMVDVSGTAINTYSYDIYGNIISANEAGGTNPIRYAGQYYDNESEMYYLRARYYDPGLMRFITEDTNKGDMKDPLSLNLFVYCTGNPIRFIDRTGNKGEDDVDPGNPLSNIEATPSRAPAYEPGGQTNAKQLNAGTPNVASIEPSQNRMQSLKRYFSQFSNSIGSQTFKVIKGEGVTEKIVWPPNGGAAAGTEKNVVLTQGYQFDRYGYDGGNYVAPVGTPYEMRSLAPGTELKPYKVFEVVKPIRGIGSITAPWFDQPGGGIQFELEYSIEKLLELKWIKEVNP